MQTALVRGTSDVASAVAHVLFTAGMRTVLHDSDRPSHSRRGMAFVDALYEGATVLENVLGKKVQAFADLVPMARCGHAVPVTHFGFEKVLEAVRPDVLIDARMRKREQPQDQQSLASLTIGLGPNFEAGRQTHATVETAWGDELGRVRWSGRTQPFGGEPQAIRGYSRERYLYAPVAGIFATRRCIGEAVQLGQELARIGNAILVAPLTGTLRGLTHDGAIVAAGSKVIEVDPRGDATLAFGLGERPRRIAAGVLSILEECGRS
jgi:xanthine dehydrogenase accessory factor